MSTSEWEEMQYRARRFLWAAGLSDDESAAFIKAAAEKARAAAYASVRPNEEVFREHFEHIVDMRANGDRNNKDTRFKIEQKMSDNIAAMRGIVYGIWR